MNSAFKKIDIFVVALLLEFFILVSFLLINLTDGLVFIDFIMLCMTFFIAMITYTTGLVIGLIITAVIIFTYASYIFYNNLVNGIGIETLTYLWMFGIPLITITIGSLSHRITTLQDTNRKLAQEYKNLVMIDEQTGLGNIKLFYRELDREISKAKRHQTPCTLMLIKLPYHQEIKNIIGESKTNELIKEISDVIVASTRNEDDRYTLENDTLAIIMPNTPLTGANVVKERIKQGFNHISLQLKADKKYVDIDTKIAVLEYHDDMKSPIEFKTLVEEELQYDV